MTNFVHKLKDKYKIQPAPADSAGPTPALLKDVYYHGTDTKAKADKIWREGIKPDLADYEGLGRPIEGRVYITRNLDYAIPYALGANMAGEDLHSHYTKKYGPAGYVFVIPGAELHDVHPDEDQVGQAVYEQAFKWLDEMAEEYLVPEPPTPDLEDFYENLHQQVVQSGDIDSFILAGKELMPHLSDKQRIQIIKKYGNIAHEGPLRPSQMWSIERSRCKDLERDGSNFFDVAQLVESRPPRKLGKK